MNKLLRSFLAVTAVLTLAPMSALALPQYCHEVCEFTSSCDQLCVIGSHTITTCGDYGICGGARDEPTDEKASLTGDEARQAESSSLVCSEAQRDAEPSAPVES